jgi:hypothetical protein
VPRQNPAENSGFKTNFKDEKKITDIHAKISKIRQRKWSMQTWIRNNAAESDKHQLTLADKKLGIT